MGVIAMSLVQCFSSVLREGCHSHALFGQWARLAACHILHAPGELIQLEVLLGMVASVKAADLSTKQHTKGWYEQHMTLVEAASEVG